MSEKIYNWLIKAITTGMVLGMFSMIQPWSLAAFRIGFLVLFYSTLGYIIFSHVTPRKETSEE